MTTGGSGKMTGKSILEKMGDLLGRLIPSRDSGELESLRTELKLLREKTDNIGNGLRQNSADQHPDSWADLVRGRNREIELLNKEIEILRNEIQENIAAIHRLEILTLNSRIQLLADFEKSLPPTVPGRTRRAAKPQGYTFGIITNGQRNHKLLKLIETIRAQKLHMESYEIIIAGTVSELEGMEGIKTVSMDDAAAEGRLGAMRNVLAKSASFNKFVSLDDDFLLHPQWAEAVDEVQGDFDVATGIILNPDLSRYCDWVNVIENYTFLRTYNESFDKCQYMTGGYGIYKDFLFEEHSWNDELGFYQGEDVSFSRKLFDAGYQLKFIPKAIVMHDDERYRQKGYGVIRLKHASERDDASMLTMKMEKLCPRTLS
jgi:hypothetical protein